MRTVRLSLVFIFIGFSGAAARYWRWWPSYSTRYFTVAGIICPFCPNIDGLGTDWEKFVGRTVFGGLLNLVPLLVVGWLITGILVMCKRSRTNC